jgi:hypothetical protein
LRAGESSKSRMIRLHEQPIGPGEHLLALLFGG